MVSLARKNLLHDRLRFAITVAGVAFAVTLVFVQAGLFAGLLGNSTVTIERISADLWVTSRNTPNVDFSHTFPETYVNRVRSVPGVARADNLIVWYVQMALPSGAQEAVEVYALDDFRAWGIPWNVAEGRLEDLPRGDNLFLDDSATRRFGAFRVGEYREVMGRRMKVIGRTRDAVSFTTTPLAFLDYEKAQALAWQLLSGNTTYVVVKLAPGADVEAVRAEIRRRLPYNDVHTREEWAALSRDYWVTSTGLGMNMAMTVFLGVLVGVVVVAQTLYTSTMEHLKEFGTVKAIGGSNADIYRILAEQALIAAVVGFLLGGAMAWGARPLMAGLNLKLVVTPALAAAVFAGTLVLCLLASMVSFRKVASIDPALVFRG
ncbi:FtsX-like permease family protein [Acidobacteria bacterium ACD]|nr:MAG: FtsX-like permease family protein [Acidobacteriota bacterium]MCE7957498.1 ABC transporter permease [Acidobacteria bacterium ACB2]MDL1948555.1 FtsX-like permease family protein [Acidobacteria bacterium ACD]